MQAYAIKRVKLGQVDKQGFDSYANEITLLQRLKGNPYIVNLLHSEIDYSRRVIHMVRIFICRIRAI